MITTQPPTVPAVTSEIKSWFLRLLRLVLDASRLVSSPLGLWGAGWIVRFDWVVCGEKMSGKKIWLIEWERAVRVILASSPATAESRASEQSKAHIFKTNYFFRVTFSVSNYYLLKKNSRCFQCLHITDITAFAQWHRFLHILLLVRQAPFKMCCIQMGIAHKRRGGVKAC